jgi:hypothetical protein
MTINFAKAVFTFLIITYANGLYAQVGPRGVFDEITAINPGVHIWEKGSKHGMDHVPLASLMNHCMFFYDRQLN